MWLVPLKNFILDLLFPKRCFKCHHEGVLLCGPCRETFALIPPACFVCKAWKPETKRLNAGRTCPGCRKKTHVHGFFSPLLFSDPLVREMVHGLKYGRLRELGEIFGLMLADYCQKFDIEFMAGTVVIPIPLHKKRERFRGFNQSELITNAFAETLRLQTVSHVLKRVKHTVPQVELSAGERRQNAQGVFRVVLPAAIQGKTILLVDDVKTTGATLEAAALALTEAGAAKIYAMTAAH